MSSYKKSSVRHWSERVNEAVILRGSNGSFNLCIEGGSEYGQFVVIGDIISDKVNYKLGNLSPGELVLEINGRHVAGYTQTDAIALIKQSQEALELVSVYPGQGISRDLRKYLGTRFQRGSVDHELQQTIRDNLYMRTVPCTTRQPRDGEVPGVDYEFLTVDQYLELEKSGKLLESGFYEGNYYGTPKPPKTPMTPGTGTIRKVKKKPAGAMATAITSQSSISARKPSQSEEGPALPKNWQIAYTKDGETYYVDHSTGRTQWEDPRKKVPVEGSAAHASSTLSKAASTSNSQLREDENEGLPEGWEKVEDSKYGTYYIDHVNRRTQYERPTAAMKRRPSQSSVHSTKSIDREQRKKSMEQMDIKGETFRIGLRKGDKGFGFTIVGGERPGELLQINNIVRGGTADLDGRLRTGDTIVRLNGRNVTSWTHQDIVRFLQSTRLGDLVEVDIVRGYSLPFDPSDPAVKKVGSNTFVKSSSSIAEGTGSMRTAQSNQSLSSNTSTGTGKRHPSQDLDGNGYAEIRTLSRSNTPSRSTSRVGPPELFKVTVTKGNKGFGFTIADSSYGQRVKEIIDMERCRGLQYGDLLLQINNTKVQHLDHSEVVDMLKFCPKDVETFFIVQRGGALTAVKPVPTPPVRRESTSRPADQQPMRSKSTPATTHHDARQDYADRDHHTDVVATSGETTENKSPSYAEDRTSLQRDTADGRRPGNDAPSSNDAVPTSSDFVMTLTRGEGGFGFRITGGQEEQTQVAIDTIVPNGQADRDGRLRTGDLILAIDGINVVGASHRRVISLMGNGALNGQVTLRVRRKGQPTAQPVSSSIQDGRRSAPPTASYSITQTTTSTSGYQSDVPQNLRQTRFGSNTRAKSLTNGVSMPGMDEIAAGSSPFHQQQQPQSRLSRPKSLTDGVPEDALNGWSDDYHQHGGGRASGHDSMRRQSDGRIFKSTPDVTKIVRASEGVTPVAQRVERPGPRHVPPPVAPKPKTISKLPRARELVLRRNENEGFGFVIMSSINKVGSIIGRIIPGSPADRCGELHVDDRLLAVNGRSVAEMAHSDIVASVKHSGMAVTLRIERPAERSETQRSQSVPATQMNSYRQSDTEVDQEMQRREAAERNKEDFRRQQQEILQKQQDEMRRLEEARRRGVRDRELSQPPRPKSAPLHNRDHEIQHDHYQSDAEAKWNGGHTITKDNAMSNGSRQYQRVTVQAQGNDTTFIDRKHVASTSTPSLREERKPLIAVRKINPGDVASVVLPRGEKGFGFSIRGGEQLPLFVLRIAEGGPAALDGRLKVGDEILEINNKTTESLSHADAVGMIRLCTDRVSLVIKRPYKAAAGEEQAANGPPRTSSRGDSYFTIPRSGSSRSIERPKSVNY